MTKKDVKSITQASSDWETQMVRRIGRSLLVSSFSEEGYYSEDGRTIRVPLKGIPQYCVELRIVSSRPRFLLRIFVLKVQNRQLQQDAIWEITLSAVEVSQLELKRYIFLIHRTIRKQNHKSSEEMLDFLQEVQAKYTTADGQLDWAALARKYGK